MRLRVKISSFLKTGIINLRDNLWMWVDPHVRRKGIGRMLLSESLAWCRRRGVQRIQLDVTENNTAAIALYQSAGFQDTGLRRPLRPRSNLEARRMVLELAG